MDRITGMQLFIRVVETGSFSKGASELGITQPTATKHVAALEARLGARLLHRSTRGVTPTEVGALYYDKCKAIEHQLEEADNVASLQQSQVGGRLRVSCSVAFGRRVLVPLVLRFMREHPGLSVDLSFDDRYVNLVEQGVDLAVRMGPLADSTLGARYLGTRGMPASVDDLAQHRCLVYSSVQGDDRWSFTLPDGSSRTVGVAGPLRSNNLSALLAACRAGMGLAVLPGYVARDALNDGSVVPVLPGLRMPAQDMHAVFPSPKLVPGKVQVFISWLKQALSDDDWWRRGA
jgi:DNA-binding transcriptional LysR family regulator